jgi:hypothetical protein
VGNWFIGMTPHQIYEALTTGPGSDTVDNAQATAKLLWSEEDKRADLIRRQGELIQTGWQGSASDGAYGAAQPLAASALNRVDELDRAQDLLDRQSGSFNRAKNDVRPVPSDPPSIDLTDPAAVFSDFEKEMVSYQADAYHNIEVFRGYDNASNHNETYIPSQYSTVNGSGGTISVSDTGARGDDTGSYIEVPDSEEPSGGPGPGPSGERVPTGSTPTNWPPPVSGPVPNPSQPQQTTPSTYVPPAINTPGQFPPGQNPYQPAPPGSNPPGYVSGLPVSGPGVRGGGFGPRGGGPGGGGQGGNPGAGARGAMPGPGGAAAGALAAEEAAARRAAAAAARGGVAGGMGGAPMGGGRGKGDDDEEHKRKVLIEADAEGVFGSDVLTAPQVIGDDEYEDD